MTVETVTSETLAEFQAARIPELKEEPKEEEKKEEKVEIKEEPQRKPKLEQRFSELTQRAKQAEERANAAEAKARELEAKANPPKKEPIDPEVGPEPKPADYTDAFDYAKDLAKWQTDKALKDRDAADAKKQHDAEQAKVLKAWQGRLAVAKEAIPDFSEVVASSSLSVSDVVKDAIIESEYGPEILYHFAGDDDEAAKLNDMTVKQALKHIGRLEHKFESSKEEKPKVEVKVVEAKEVKRPPEPIKPINGRNSADNPVSAPGEFKGSYQEWKALRMAGKS